MQKHQHDDLKPPALPVIRTRDELLAQLINTTNAHRDDIRETWDEVTFARKRIDALRIWVTILTGIMIAMAITVACFIYGLFCTY